MSQQQASEREQEVLRRLATSDAADVRQAAFDASDARLKSAVPLLVEHLASSSVGVQEAAEHALRKIRGAGAVQAVAPLLRLEAVGVRNIAMDVLREIGVDDMGALTRLLSDEDVDIRIFVADILGSTRSPLALAPLCDALLRDKEVNVRYQAAVSLGELRNPGAAESLRQAIHDEEWVQYAAVEALAKIRDGSCVDILIQALETSSPLVASTILDALGDINDVKAVPLLLPFLDNSSGPLRTKALKAIIQILGPNALTLLGAKQLDRLQAYMLAALADDEDEDTLSVVLRGLATTGVNPAATRAVLDLVARSNPDKQQDLLQQAFLSLVGIGYNEALEEALHDENSLVRGMAVSACGNIPGRAGKYALKRHFDSLINEDRQQAMELLAQHGDDRDIPFFSNHIISTEDPLVLRPALHFLGNHMRHAPSAPRMIQLLGHESPIVRESALSACLALEDADTISAIVSFAGDINPAMRRMAAYTMGYADALAFAEQLAQALQDPAAEVRKVALEAIGYGWPVSEEKLSALAYALRDENREVRLIAVEQLGEYVDETVTPLLLDALSDPDDWVRVRAVEALGRNRVTEAAPSLVTLMEYPGVLVQLKIIEALSLIGGDIAFRALLALITHEDPEIRSAAAEAVARIRAEEGGERA